MAEDDSGLIPFIPWGIVLAGTLSALAFVIFYIVPNCAGLPVWGKVDGQCGTTKMGIIYVCSAMFLAGAAYSLFRIAVVARQRRAG